MLYKLCESVSVSVTGCCMYVCKNYCVREAGCAYKLCELVSVSVGRCCINCVNGIGYDVIVQELCESRGGRPELSVLTSLLASVDVKIY